MIQPLIKTTQKNDLSHKRFLVENWLRLISRNQNNERRVQPEYEKYIHVKNKTATVVNQRLVIRAPINLIDGIYSVDSDYQFHKEQYRETRALFFPDVGVWEPDPRYLEARCELNYSQISYLKNYSSACVDNKTDVALEPDFIGAVNGAVDPIPFDFHLSPPMTFQADDLLFSFVEMLRYCNSDTDRVRMYQEKVCLSPDKTMFLMGLDWNRCVLIRAKDVSYTANGFHHGQLF